MSSTDKGFGLTQLRSTITAVLEVGERNMKNWRAVQRILNDGCVPVTYEVLLESRFARTGEKPVMVTETDTLLNIIRAAQAKFLEASDEFKKQHIEFIQADYTVHALFTVGKADDEPVRILIPREHYKQLLRR